MSKTNIGDPRAHIYVNIGILEDVFESEVTFRAHMCCTRETYIPVHVVSMCVIYVRCKGERGEDVGNPVIIISRLLYLHGCLLF